MRLFAVILVVLVMCAVPSWAQQAAEAPTFSDVPADHWAGDAVNQLFGQGILNGYPDGTFKGDKPVTRYELAAALARFTELLAPTAAAQQASPKVSIEVEKISKAASKVPGWVISSTEKLKSGKFLPDDSPIITGGNKPATVEDLAQALASISARIIELTVPADPETVE